VRYEEVDEEPVMSRPVTKLVKAAPVVEPEAAAPEPELVASVEQPVSDPVPFSIPEGQEGWVTVALAVIGIAGGGALWKYLTKRGEQQHEAEMRRIEVEGLKHANHQSCDEARKILEARIDVLSSRLDSFSASVAAIDFDGVEDRLDAIEKSLRKRSLK
jgi:hypothetical protein